MKFLIAASFLCLALVGQIQGGSLRGLTVPIPHRIYGAPLPDIEEVKPIIEDKDTTIIEVEKPEEPMVPLPSAEYGAPAEQSVVNTVPFVDSLPLVDSVVNFGTPSDVYGPPAKPIEIIETVAKPELPYLKPGLPDLPEAPIVPEIVEEPVIVNEVSNAYLPPVVEAPSTPAPLIIEEFKPSEVYGPPKPAETPKDAEIVEIPTITDLPALPELPVTPLPTPIVEEAKPGYDYSPPAIAFDLPKVTIHAPELPVEVKPEVLYGAPLIAKPEVHFVDIPLESPKQGYFYKAPVKEFPTPISVPVVHGLVNKFVLPSEPSSVFVKDIKRVGPGFAVHSINRDFEISPLRFL